MRSRKNIFIWSTLLLVIIGVFLGVVVAERAAGGKYDEFAQCLTDNGTKMYGAFWCPHCQTEKKKFGKSWKYIDYVECSTADGRGQLPVCQEAGIQSYPVWAFSSGNRITGTTTFEDLAREANCPMPQ